LKARVSLERGRIVLLLWIALAIGALATNRPTLYNLWYLLTALLIFSYLWAWVGTRWVEVQRFVRTGRSQVGKMAEERLVVENRGRIPKLWLEVRDHSTLPNHRVSQVISPLPARKMHSRTIRTRCLQRGRFTLGPLTLVSGDPFGLFRTSRRLAKPAESNFIVYPATVDVPIFASLVGFLPGGDTMSRRTHYVTTNVSGVRDYAPGDSFNRIHWPSTARTGRLISKEFELDPTADVWLFLDLERGSQAELVWASLAAQSEPRLPWEAGSDLSLMPSTVEYGVTIVASLAKHFLARDRAVGFIAYSEHREVIPADRGERQLTKILETLAVLRAEGRIPLIEIIAAEGAHLMRNTTAIVVTSSTQSYWIAAARDMNQRGIRVIAVLVDPHSFGHTRSNEELTTELAISGIPAYLVREGDELTAALARPYMRAIKPIGRMA
jgi:uncharacterized protein (DUF58 family)